jgi:hypothetical protein
MPNWSYNILNASDEVLKQIVNEEGEIDFNTVVPMPKELQGTVSPSKDDTQEEKDASKNLIEKYGSNNWYDWSCENWGTKWNGVSDEPYTYGEGIIHFRTAWSYPESFIEALSKKFPDELIEFEWEEEQGFGEAFTIKNGEKIILEEWDLPELGEEVEVGRYIISECIEDGGREEPNIPKFKAGKWYIDMDEYEEHDSLDEAKARCKVLDEEWDKRRIVHSKIDYKPVGS